MNSRLATALLPLIVLAGCGGDEFDDLRSWMASAGKDGVQKVEPLPQVKQLETFEYDPTNLQDPFMPRNLMLPGKGMGPDTDRPKQPLEEFPLDALRMVGTISRPDKNLLAVIKDPKNALHTVQVGSRIGQNYGTITKITADGIEIKEQVPDGNGGWLSSTASMTLSEDNPK